MVNAALLVPLMALQPLLARAQTTREQMRIGISLMAMIVMEYDLEPRTLGLSEFNMIPSSNLAFWLFRDWGMLHLKRCITVPVLYLELAMLQSLNRLFTCFVLCSVLYWASRLHIWGIGTQGMGVKIWVLNWNFALPCSSLLIEAMASTWRWLQDWARPPLESICFW